MQPVCWLIEISSLFGDILQYAACLFLLLLSAICCLFGGLMHVWRFLVAHCNEQSV